MLQQSLLYQFKGIVVGVEMKPEIALVVLLQSELKEPIATKRISSVAVIYVQHLQAHG